MSKDKTTDRVLQFHGGRCGNRDKAVDTTQSNTAHLWKLFSAIHKGFSVSVSLTREKYKMENLNYKTLYSVVILCYLDCF